MSVLPGLRQLVDVYGDTPAADIPNIDDLFNRALDFSNAELNAMYASLTSVTTDPQVRFRSAQNFELQRIDPETGRAQPVRLAGQYTVGFPLDAGGAALGDTYKAMVKMTGRDLANRADALIIGDNNWNASRIIAVLLDNAGYTFEDEEHGDIMVKGLANGDNAEYAFSGSGPDGDSHYTAKGGAPADTDFEDLVESINEHPGNVGQLVAIVPTNLKSGVMALPGFESYPDPNIRVGVGTDQVVTSIGANVPGQPFGYHRAGCHLIEWRRMPSNYIAIMATGGEPAVIRREEPESVLRGFSLRGVRNDYPYMERQFVREAGYGGWNRVGAAVKFFGGAAYAIPASFDAAVLHGGVR